MSLRSLRVLLLFRFSLTWVLALLQQDDNSYLITNTAVNGHWGWEQCGSSEDEKKGSYLLFRAASSGPSCPLWVSPLRFALECIKSSLLWPQQTPLLFLPTKKPCSLCFPSYVNLFLFFPLELPLALLLSDHPTVWAPVCTKCSLFSLFLMAEFQPLGNLYRRPVVAAAQICCTRYKSQQRWIKWAHTWELKNNSCWKALKCFVNVIPQ